MGKVVIPGFRKIETSGGGGSATNYNDLSNKPSINNVPLVGNLKTVDLKLTDPTLTEEGVPAEAKEVGLRLESHSTSLTELSEQLGSHTVKSDVPENAVFTDTVYDDTEIKESLSKQSSEMMDIKMLGWSVPKECPIQNEVNGNQFTQKVGRVDLGSLAFQYDTTEGHERMRTVSVLQGAKGALVDNIGNIYTSIYTRSSANYTYLHRTDKTISIDDYCVIWIYDTSYTDASTFKQAMQGQYLYYELANYNTITIDGNEEVSLLLKRIEALESLVNKTDTTTIESE